MSADALQLNHVFNSDRRFYLFVPGTLFLKIITRYFLLFFLIVFSFVLSPFAALFLPICAIVYYKFHLFTSIALQFNLSPIKLWIAVGVWCIFVCLPISVLLKNMIIT